MSDLIETDVLVIGCGIGGGVTALRLAQQGIHVTLITRSHDPQDSSTAWAQGGIIYRGHDDSPQLLAEDIERAGAGFSNPSAVRILAEEGPALVREILIEQLNVPFDHHGDGVALALEGGHRLPRIAHAADATGAAIEYALLAALRRESNVTLLTGHTAIDLITPSHHAINRLAIYEPQSCVGAYVLDRDASRVKRVLAKRTVLATGGLGQIYLYTTNPSGARGDGLAMAYRAGARVINAEFVQFHPTAFAKPGAPRFLITEAVRGDGGRLVHADGEPFMQKYDPAWKDLAPRDVVARSIYFEMLERGVPHVYLNLRDYIKPERIREHFPNIYKQCLEYGVDMTCDLVPVAPAAHYFCGGVWADEHGRTTIERLYAVGEVSCTGLHGANRLASTSLLEGLVWGVRAANHIAAHIADDQLHDPNDIPEWRENGVEHPDPALIAQDMGVIRGLMWNYVGLVRNKPRLDRALSELRHLETEIERFYRKSKVTDELIGLRNAVRSAVIVAQAAWSNKQSIGVHYRES
ncbi:MAG: L-aspartate oxidase [Candidatus Roseilinea sp.]|nr:MAG: L-aspartate oxidase [Candidatus Roseilinea sp.]